MPLEIGANARHRLGMPPARFLRDYWQKRPLLIRHAFPDFTPPLSPDDLAGLACMDGALARIVLHDAKRDRWTLRSGPFDDAAFAKLPKSRWTVLVQDVDKWDADTAALLAPFDFIPSWRIDDVMISYAVDGGGVGAHVDQYDVFLLQGMGQRRWSIDTRPNPPNAFREDVELKLLREFNPTHTWTLGPGDMLYLPPGVPHDGVAVGECMTFSIGMRAPSKAELLVVLAEQVATALPDSQRYADSGLRPATATGEIDAAALRRARDALEPVARMLDPQAFADFFGRFVTAYRGVGKTAARKRAVRPAALDEALARSRFHRNPWSRCAWRRAKRGAMLYVAGEQYACALVWARALCGDAATEGARLAALPARREGVTLLAELINAGHLVWKHR
ncbi:MAG TPA: cupin domain-containing protein [Rhodanobacteraceae bacterium]|nr:cupin domain-containing protein [Rhodanobacteraceae bacterium]